MTTLVSEWPSAGRRCDSGNWSGIVSAFGAVAPTIMPSSRPAPDRLRATVGSDSRLQASLRITRLMTHSTGPLPTATSGCAKGTVSDPAGPGGPGGWVDTRVTWAIPPLADLRGSRLGRCSPARSRAPRCPRHCPDYPSALVLAQRRRPAEGSRQIRLNRVGESWVCRVPYRLWEQPVLPGCLNGCD